MFTMSSETISEPETTTIGGHADQPSFHLDIVYYGIGIMGIIGNIFVVVIMLMSRKLRRRSANLIITNQSIIDGAACVFLIAITNKSVVRNQVMCDFWFTKLPLWSLLVASTYNLIFLALDRYLAIAWPLRHRVSFSSGKVTLLLLLPWIFGFAFNVSYMLPTTVYVSENNTDEPGHCDKFARWPNDEFQFGFAVVIVFVQYIIPISLQILFYSLIVYTIRRRSQGISTDGRSSPVALVCHRPPYIWSRAQRNSVKTASIVSLCFVLCWTVDQFFFCKYFFTGAENYDNSFFDYTLVIVAANCSVNPVIYSLQYESFRLEARKMICRSVPSDKHLVKTYGPNLPLQKATNIFYIAKGWCMSLSSKHHRGNCGIWSKKHVYIYIYKLWYIL